MFKMNEYDKELPSKLLMIASSLLFIYQIPKVQYKSQKRECVNRSMLTVVYTTVYRNEEISRKTCTQINPPSHVI